MRSINGVAIGDGKVPGPITRRLTEAYLTEAYKEEVRYDFVAQYLEHVRP